MRIRSEKNIIQNKEKKLDSNDDIYGWLKDMFPIHRSLTGNGNRRTLKYLQSLVPNLNLMEIKSGEKPALTPDKNAKYFAEVVIDLDQIDEPMIADPDVNNVEISKRYTHDTIRPISYYGAEKKVDLGFVGSCMVHKGDMKILAQMLKNVEAQYGKVEFKESRVKKELIEP